MEKIEGVRARDIMDINLSGKITSSELASDYKSAQFRPEI